MKPRTEKQQPTFAAVADGAPWRLPHKPSRGWDVCVLAPEVLEELREFKATLLRQAQVCEGTAHSYRKALACVAKQAQRFLTRQLRSLRELYDVNTIAAVAADDRPFDEITEKISKYTLRQRRVALRAYLRAVGLPGRSFEEAARLLDEGFRRAATRRGDRYMIQRGRPEGTRYRPPVEDVDRVVAVARNARTSFLGPRNAAILVLAQHAGLRSHSLLAMSGSDLSWRRDRLFLLVKEKARLGRREVEVPPEAVAYLDRYVAAYNGFATGRGWPDRIAVGLDGAFWRSGRGRAWTYGGLLALVRIYTRAAGVRPFEMHGLRHLRAAVLGAHLPVDEAASAGGWENPGVYLRHYAKPLHTWQPELPGSDLPAVERDHHGPTGPAQSARRPRANGESAR